MLPIASSPQGALPLHSLSMRTPASFVEGGLGFSSFLGLAALSLSALFAASSGASHFGVVSFTSVRLVLLPGPCCCSVLSDTLKPHGGQQASHGPGGILKRGRALSFRISGVSIVSYHSEHPSFYLDISISP